MLRAAAGPWLSAEEPSNRPTLKGGLVLRNCPFHGLAQRDPELVCGLNASFIDGILRGLGNTTVSAELVPQEGLCCVAVRPPGSYPPEKRHTISSEHFWPAD